MVQVAQQGANDVMTASFDSQCTAKNTSRINRRSGLISGLTTQALPRKLVCRIVATTMSTANRNQRIQLSLTPVGFEFEVFLAVWIDCRLHLPRITTYTSLRLAMSQTGRTVIFQTIALSASMTLSTTSAVTIGTSGKPGVFQA
jgi:hypothetical protein